MKDEISLPILCLKAFGSNASVTGKHNIHVHTFTPHSPIEQKNVFRKVHFQSILFFSVNFLEEIRIGSAIELGPPPGGGVPTPPHDQMPIK